MTRGFFHDLKVLFGPQGGLPETDTERGIVRMVTLHNTGDCGIVEYDALMRVCVALRHRRELTFIVPAARGDYLTPMERVRHEWALHYAMLAGEQPPAARVVH